MIVILTPAFKIIGIVNVLAMTIKHVKLVIFLCTGILLEHKYIYRQVFDYHNMYSVIYLNYILHYFP